MELSAMARFKRATENVKSGNYASALDDFKLLHDNPCDQSYDYVQLRRGTALASWVALGRYFYPPALIELENILQSKLVRQGNGDPDPLLNDDIAAIQRFLKEMT
jgi:hypothetical protein